MGVTHKDFGAKTGAMHVAGAFGGEIRDKIVVITGASPQSIGCALALALASQAPHLLILASRTLEKIHAITRLIHASNPEVQVKAVVVDLSSQQSVRKAAGEIEAIVREIGAGRGIDVLFNNAGINISERALSPEGIELQFATNHVGPFLLTNLLLPLLVQQEHPGTHKRIVNTSSEAHRISPVRFSDINQTPGAIVEEADGPRRGLPEGILRGDGRYEPAVAYGASKTANVLTCVGLNKRVGGVGGKIGVKSFAVMPGTIKQGPGNTPRTLLRGSVDHNLTCLLAIMTELVRGLDEESLKGLVGGTPDSEWKTLDQGAATLVVAGFDPGLDGVYLDDCQMRRPSKWAVDPVKAERLWKVSEEMVGQDFGFGGEGETSKGKGKGSRL